MAQQNKPTASSQRKLATAADIFVYRWPRLTCRYFYFAPRAIVTLITALLIPIFLSLGFWQWHRAELNGAIVQAYAQRARAPIHALPLTPAQMIAHMRFARMASDGYFANAHAYLLDNAVVEHRVGYRVLTVFLPKNNASALLVDRGFIPVINNRKQLPVIKPVYELQHVEGILDRPYQPAYTLHHQQKATNQTSHLLQEVNIATLSKAIGRPLYPLVLVATSINPNIYYLQTLPRPPNKVIMHQGYAFQWFTFALTLFIIYIVVNMKKMNPNESK